ncbi:MAG: histidine kinase [Potamolinea sp.]
MGQQHLPPDNENQLVALGRVLQTLREEENAEVLIETTLDYLKAELKYPLIWIGLYDRMEHRLFGKGGITPIGETKFLKQRFNLNPGDILEQVVIEQRPLSVADLRSEVRAGEWRKAAIEFGIQGALIFPLRFKDRCFGVALLGSQQWGISPRPTEKSQLSLLLGSLAAALYQIEEEWQRSTTKRPDQALFHLLEDLVQFPTLTQRLDTVVKMAQQFVAPTRTNLYWYSPERRYFWQRVGKRQSVSRLGDSRTSASGLTVAEANDFYQALVAGQLVAIGAGRSMLKAESTERLLGRVRARSLLAAPIQARGELLGFLAVEDQDARIWEEEESNYVRACAQLLGVLAGSEKIEATLQETQTDIHFTAEIAQLIARSNDVQVTLKHCSQLLCKRLDAELFLVLQEDNKGDFAIVFQQQPPKRRPLTTPFSPLSHDDWRSLFNSTEAVMIEDLEEDGRLFSWRQSLSQLGVRSLLICQIANTDNPDSQGRPALDSSLLVIGHQNPRTWNPRSQELTSIVAQQINLLLTLSQLQKNDQLSLIAHQTLQTGLSTLTQNQHDPVLLERAWVEHLATVIECPLVALLSWTPDSELATVATAVVNAPSLCFSKDLTIPVARDSLIQEALSCSGFLGRAVTELSADTRKWLSSPGIGQILVIALHTDGTPTTAILLLADREERQWPNHLLPPLEILTTQFAWFRLYGYYLNNYAQDNEAFQTLNWYKHRCLEILHQSCLESISALLEVQSLTPTGKSTGELNQPLPTDSGEIKSKPASTSHQSLQQMRRQQLLQQLEATLSFLRPVLKDEQWQLTLKLAPLPLVNLLKRSLRRIESLSKKRQLVLKVHSLGNQNIYGDQLKLECVLFELLVTSCLQAQPGSVINLWCSSISPDSEVSRGIEYHAPTNSSDSLLELSIAESRFLEDGLQPLDPSHLQFPLSTNLTICQQILRSWGGDLQFYQLQSFSGKALEEPCYSIRLLLPLAK